MLRAARRLPRPAPFPEKSTFELALVCDKNRKKIFRATTCMQLQTRQSLVSSQLRTPSSSVQHSALRDFTDLSHHSARVCDARRVCQGRPQARCNYVYVRQVHFKSLSVAVRCDIPLCVWFAYAASNATPVVEPLVDFRAWWTFVQLDPVEAPRATASAATHTCTAPARYMHLKPMAAALAVVRFVRTPLQQRSWSASHPSHAHASLTRRCA